MDIKSNGMNGTPVGDSSVATLFANAQAKLKEMQTPVSLQTYLANHQLTCPLVNFQSYHREFAHDWTAEQRRLLITRLLTTEISCDLTLKSNTTNIGVERGAPRIYVSKDLWQHENPTGDFYKCAAIASAIQCLMTGELNKRFDWQVIFYSMGYNPRQLIEEQKAIEQAAKEALHGNK